MSSVIIKNQKYGILLKLDPGAPLDELLRETAEKFALSASFFGEAYLTLSFTGRTMTSEEEDLFVHVIEENSGIRILCVYVNDEERCGMSLRAAHLLEEQRQERIEAMIRTAGPAEDNGVPFRVLTGNIPEGKVLRFSENILLLGSIEDGAALISKKNVIVTGDINGAVYAGDSKHAVPLLDEDSEPAAEKKKACHFVAAGGRINARRIVIDGIARSARGGIGLLSKKTGEAAWPENGSIVIRELGLLKEDHEDLSGFLTK